MFTNFKDLLDDRNMSVAELAAQSGLTRQYCYNLVNGKYHPDSIAYGVYTRLSGVLGELPADLWSILFDTMKK